MFGGKTGMSIVEWTEEVQAYIRARRLSVFDKALFMFDHLQGEAREKTLLRFLPSWESYMGAPSPM